MFICQGSFIQNVSQMQASLDLLIAVTALDTQISFHEYIHEDMVLWTVLRATFYVLTFYNIQFTIFANIICPSLENLRKIRKLPAVQRRVNEKCRKYDWGKRRGISMEDILKMPQSEVSASEKLFAAQSFAARNDDVYVLGSNIRHRHYSG